MKEFIIQKLDEIESEMKAIGYWAQNPPDLIEKIKNGEIKSYMDAPSFELWLQTVFLIQARQRVLHNNLPTDSHVGQMAMREYNFHSYIEEAQTLLKLLNEFDELIRKNSSNQGGK